MPPSVDNMTRPMIGAMFRGPGPAYALPGLVGYIGHDATKLTAPRYLFGIKGKPINEKKDSPGPAAYTLLERSTRYGKDGTPRYTLHYRPKDSNTFITPSPAAYHTESVRILKQPIPPSYSFGSRTKYSEREKTPAPNAYSLPNMTGNKNPIKCSPPSYSMPGRAKVGGFSEDFQQTPGPAAYKVVGVDTWRKKAPMFSMSARCFLPGDNSQKPGPGAHSPEKVFVTRRTAPSCSFGIRHSEYIAPLITEVL